MDTKKLYNILTEINTLEANLLRYNDLAIQFANNDCRIKIKVENFDKKRELESTIQKEAGEGFHIDLLSMMSGRFTTVGSSSNRKAYEAEELIEITDVAALDIMAYVIREKLERLDKLKKSVKGKVLIK